MTFDSLSQTLSDYFKSPAEKAVDAQLIGNAPTMTRIPLNAQPGDPGIVDKASATLSGLWASAELAITPESQGEALVNQIYGRDENGNPLTPPNITPIYNVDDLATPAVIVKAKQAITTAFDSVQNTFIKYAIIAVAIILAGTFMYALAMGAGRKLAA